ncbi:MAG: exodeoxyribonuclease VII large subunit [Desulfovibrio sp.]|nr:exodeoxyribonuclease VII large subunit [Desulfovibrio sp.]
MQNGILTVRALTEQLRKNLEGRFPFVWVRGEVSNLSRPASGHLYFSLKDAEAQLQCVWFRGQQGQAFDPLTGEVFDSSRPSPLDMLRNGAEMLCAGRITVYPARGQYQLLVEMAQPAGEGLLAQTFEARKRQLAAAGYFAQARKRPLPWDPQRVALLTSSTGAAIHDFMRLARNRGSGAQIRLFAVPVQGEEAAPAMVRALETVDRQGWAEVVVLIRGGGSLEDLWAYNEECLATAVFSSVTPVLAGIGHEVDVTLTDLTADMRAATPSHAAQLLWPDRNELRQRLDEALLSLQRVAGQWLAHKERAWEYLERARRTALGLERLAVREAGLEMARHRLDAAVRHLLAGHEHALQKSLLALEACDPLAPLRRGYALVYGAHGRLVRSVTETESGSRIDVRLHDGHVAAVVEDREQLTARGRNRKGGKQ